ncbi:hypothetical protein BH18VER2_BH18VER2_15980 [soil metagenome]
MRSSQGDVSGTLGFRCVIPLAGEILRWDFSLPAGWPARRLFCCLDRRRTMPFAVFFLSTESPPSSSAGARRYSGISICARSRRWPVAKISSLGGEWNRRPGRNLCRENVNQARERNLSLTSSRSRTGTPAEGVEVIAGRDAVQVGESIHRLGSGAPEVTAAILHDARPAAIELQLYYPGGGHGAAGVPHPPRCAVLRFPIGRGCWKEAGAVVSHPAAMDRASGLLAWLGARQQSGGPESMLPLRLRDQQADVALPRVRARDTIKALVAAPWRYSLSLRAFF